METGRDIAPCLLLFHDLPQHSLLALLIEYCLGLFLDLAGILDDRARRYEPQGIDGLGCHHGILLQFVIIELFVELLIVQMSGFGQQLLGLGVIADPYHLVYFL